MERTDLKQTDVQLADVEGANEKGRNVIVQSYCPRPPGRGLLILAKHCYCLRFCGFSFGFTFYGVGDIACVQTWRELDTRD